MGKDNNLVGALSRKALAFSRSENSYNVVPCGVGDEGVANNKGVFGLSQRSLLNLGQSQ